MNRESALNKTYQRFIEICIKSISEDELDELAISEIMGFGTARDEIIKGVEEAKDLLRKQREQSKGLKIQYILKPHFRKINEKTSSAIVVDEIEIEMQSEDFNHQLLLRITTCLEIQNEEWKVVHWHGSIPQESTSEDTWHIDEWKRKAEELQNLVDQKTTQLSQQNKELEIEAALERVRSTAMAMFKPEDLSTICEKVFHEMKGLGFNDLRNTEVILNQDEKENIRSYYYSDYGVTGVVDVDCKSHPTILKWFHDLQKQDDAFAEVTITSDQMKEWEAYRQSLGYVPDPKLKKADQVFYYSYATGSGALSISSFTSLEHDEIEVLKRFRNVFNLAYKRYNDIRLAEQQAREAQIEAALERVRSKGMSIMKSDELSDVISVVFEQLRDLGFETPACGLSFYNEDDSMTYWMAGFGNEVYPRSFQLPVMDHPYYHDQLNAWKEQPEFREFVFEGKLKKSYDAATFEQPDFFDIPLEIKDEFVSIESVIVSNAFMKYGMIEVMGENHLSKNEREVLTRFAKVFEQSYTRFLDLQNAEKRTRAAQVEAALERVRARSMAMHSSDELGDVAKVMFDQMQKLGGDLYSFAVVLCDKHEDVVEQWHGLGEAGMMSPFHVPIDLDYIHQYRYDQWKAGVELFSIEIPSDYIVEHFELMFDLPTVQVVKDELASKGIELTIPPWEIDYGASFNNGYLLISSLSHFEEDHIFPRFAKVFEQAYTRFLDLQKAEAQAREAQIEAGLESVRARSMAMHKSHELRDVVTEMYDKMESLGLAKWGCTIIICHEDSTEYEFWLAEETSTDHPGNFFAKGKEHPIYKKIWEHWESKSPPFTLHHQNEYKREFDEYWLYKTDFKYLPDVVKASVLDRNEVYLNYAPMRHGLLNAISYDQPSDDLMDVLARFAKVFEQTYTRFLDLQKAETQAREAQIEVALERIRSKSLAMHKTDDLRGVVEVLFEEMQGLSVEMDFGSVSIFMFNEDNRDMTQWLPLPEGVQFLNIPYFEHPINSEIFKAKERGDEFMAKVYPVEVKNSWIEKGFELTDYKNLPESFKTSILEAPGYSFTMTLAKNSGILIPNFEGKLLSEEDNEILKRVGRVFEQSYIRFLDLKKAEAQTREAEIQLALERVRAASMAMYTSDELASVTRIFFEQLVALEMDVQRSWIDIFHEEEGYIQTWSTDFEGNFQPSPSKFPTDFKDKTMVDFLADYKSPSRFIEMEAHGNEVKEWFDYLYETSSDPIFKILHVPKDLYQIWAKHKYGTVATTKLTPFTIEEKEVLARFANVFEQAYVRFLDLQIAEAQAKEAQIEAALEKLRSRTMAMQNSDELREVANVIDVQTRSLGINLWSVSYNILAEDKKSCICIPSSEGQMQAAFSIPFEGEKSFVEWMNVINRGETFYVQELEGKDLEEHYAYLMSLPGIEAAVDPLEEAGISLPTYQINHLCLFNDGILLFITYEKVPEAHDIFKRFTQVFEQTYTRFLDLKNAEAQAREAQIETAMERIRSRSLAMRTSDEIKDVMIEIRRQIDSLGQLDLEASVVHLYEKDNPMFESIAAVRPPGESGEIVLANVFFPVDCMDLIKEMVKLFWSDTKEYTLEFNKELAEEWQKVMVQHAPMIAERRVGFVKNRRISDNPEYWNFADFSEGSLLLVTHSPASEDTKTVLRKASQVFDLAYRRFRDLQKAEARAREAQIELSLEKIRARVTAMQESSDLFDIVVQMRNEFLSLGHEADYFWHMRWSPDNYEMSMTSTDGDRLGMVITVPKFVHEQIESLHQWENSTIPYFVLDLDAKDAWDYLEKMNTYGHYEKMDPNAPSEEDIHHIGGLTFIIARTTHGEIGFSLAGKVPDPPQESIDTLVRFAGVFDLAYQRFEDLKETEHQKREAEIELAMEKVRSRSMGMQSSEELEYVIKIVYDQLVGLDIFIEHTGFIMDIDTRDEMLIWLADPNGVQPQVTIPYFDSPHWNSYLEAKKKGENLFVNHLNFDEKNAFYNKLFKFIPDIPEEAKKHYLSCPGLAISTVLMDNVGLYMENFSGTPYSDEENKILLRFGKVFQQTYTRFLDLKRAEEQTRQARIETALERVRARAMAMQEPEELKDVAQVLRTEMGNLEIEELETCSIYIKEAKSSNAECWYAIKDIREDEKILVKDQFQLDLNQTWVGREMMSFYDSEEDRFSIVMKGDHRKEWIEYCAEHSDALDGYYGDVIPERTYHLYKFSNGSIGFASAGTISDESWNILTRASSAFSLAYSRFQDLTRARQDLIKLKEEKKRAEDALSELKEAQKQLIHAEKMASLGELTAGIAHEIQNPLNFVNNFSEVSHEMIEEVKEELKDGDPEEVEAILNDLTTNLKKIAHHGQRASGIVRSMLDHSRASGGDKVETDINALCDEYLRLAYHGMRAKDRNFNAELITNFDESVPKVNVIPQDIGRVLLNLINNAFQAVAETGDLTGFPDNKHKTTPEDPNSLNQSLTLNLAGQGPKVIVTTKNLGDKIEIAVADNGPGIPDDIKDKIFQPFFTTKPTGEGTGLGLSLSYDIIKAHGGKITLESSKNEGTSFYIDLPIDLSS